MKKKSASTAKPTATLLAIGLDVPGATCCTTLDEAAAHLRDVAFEVVLAAVPLPALMAWPALAHAVLDSAVVLMLADAPSDAEQSAALDR
jgi:hypothetical protein